MTTWSLYRWSLGVKPGKQGLNTQKADLLPRIEDFFFFFLMFYTNEMKLDDCSRHAWHYPTVHLCATDTAIEKHFCKETREGWVVQFQCRKAGIKVKQLLSIFYNTTLRDVCCVTNRMLWWLSQTADCIRNKKYSRLVAVKAVRVH